jgi:hypothetical protein
LLELFEKLPTVDELAAFGFGKRLLEFGTLFLSQAKARFVLWYEDRNGLSLLEDARRYVDVAINDLGG